jgi:hypothetical protein
VAPLEVAAPCRPDVVDAYVTNCLHRDSIWRWGQCTSAISRQPSPPTELRSASCNKYPDLSRGIPPRVLADGCRSLGSMKQFHLLLETVWLGSCRSTQAVAVDGLPFFILTLAVLCSHQLPDVAASLHLIPINYFIINRLMMDHSWPAIDQWPVLLPPPPFGTVNSISMRTGRPCPDEGEQFDPRS